MGQGRLRSRAGIQPGGLRLNVEIPAVSLVLGGKVVGLLPVLPRQLVPRRLRLRPAGLIRALQLRQLALLLCVVQVVYRLALPGSAVFLVFLFKNVYKKTLCDFA